MGRAPPMRHGFQHSKTRTRGSTCTGICITYRLHKKRNESVYDYAVLCSNCDMYIPRDSIIKIEGYKKFCCPCCKKNQLRGLYRTSNPPSPPKRLKSNQVGTNL